MLFDLLKIVLNEMGMTETNIKFISVLSKIIDDNGSVPFYSFTLTSRQFEPN